MRKNLALIYLLILTIGTIVSLYMPKVEATVEETEMIPDEAIRLRILANSDLEADQVVKRLIRDEVNKEITTWVEDLTSLDEARTIMSSNIPQIKKIAETIIAEKGLNQSVSVKFGKAEFPTKLYGQYLYPAGEYEAVVITLGAGEGANWWCVLFPPLCFLDFSNGTAVSQTPFSEEEVETQKPIEKEEVKSPIEENEEVQNPLEEKGEIQSPVVEKEEARNPIEGKKEAQSQIVEKEEVQNPIKEKEEVQNVIEGKEESRSFIEEQGETESILEDNQELQDQPVSQQVQVAVKQDTIYNGQEEEPIIVKSFFAELFSQIF